jgi:hypothetical protein
LHPGKYVINNERSKKCVVKQAVVFTRQRKQKQAPEHLGANFFNTRYSPWVEIIGKTSKKITGL